MPQPAMRSTPVEIGHTARDESVAMPSVIQNQPARRAAAVSTSARCRQPATSAPSPASTSIATSSRMPTSALRTRTHRADEHEADLVLADQSAQRRGAREQELRVRPFRERAADLLPLAAAIVATGHLHE